MTDYEREKARERVNGLDIRTVYSFTPSKSGLYNCPICGSGTGKHKTGALQISTDGRRITCYAEKCFTEHGEDVLGALRRLWNASEWEVFERLGIIEGGGSAGTYTQPQRKAPKPAAAPDKPQEAKADFSGYITKAQEALKNSEAGLSYLQARGITRQTAERFMLGYDGGKIVIPYGRNGSYYITRSIVGKEYGKPKREVAGPEPLYNAAAITSGESNTVFVCESPLCAISIMQEGGAAVALGGLGKNKLLSVLDETQSKKTLILCLDNDDKGQQGQRSLANALTDAGAAFIEYNIAGSYKDPNDRLQADAAGFSEAVKAAIAEAERKANEAAEAYISTSAGHRVQAFIDRIRASRPCLPTGWNGLDKILGGGIYTGLYVLGAASSLGKSTFCLQLIENMVAAGNDAIIFSLEMSADELTAKSISRLTAEIAISKGISTANAKTTRGILAYERYRGYTKEESALIMEALEEYERRTRGRLWISEGVGNIGAEQIRERVQQHISLTGRKPIILIDYLQILSPADVKASDKQNTDKSVLELKRISRDFDVPVIAISSLNRDNYLSPINMAAYKESGAIEYSSDVLIGLQYNGMDYKDGETDENRKKRVRALIKDATAKPSNGVGIQLKILKNRNGERDKAQLFTFYPLFNLYRES